MALASGPTLSAEDAGEVDGDGHPHRLPVVLRPVAPDADVHGLGARLRRQAREEQRVLGEVVRLPALALVRGEPGEQFNKPVSILLECQARKVEVLACVSNQGGFSMCQFASGTTKQNNV